MLLTKLHIPPVNQNIVFRPKLYDKLNTGLTRKLILISAPAGFGKTTLLSEWINQLNIPTAWFSIDKADNDPSEFLNYIISGIQNIHKEFGLSALMLLNSPNKPSVESIVSLLINEILCINQNFLLVLDDFHFINNSEVLKLVTYFLEHIPENIHIVILTRSDPALSVSRLRSQNQLVELRSADLGFSANDISILFNKKLKFGLSAEDVYSLETKTEGWIAGLQLTALTMQGREDISEFIQDLKGDNRYIMDYLMEEVLKIQTDDTKEFLLQTSILEQMCAPLCNAVLNRNDSQLILESLEKNNMFVIPLDNERKWYRYHHLFADLLKQRVQQKNQLLIYDIHIKACEWFEQNNRFDLAIEHAFEIKNYEKSIQLLGEIVESMWEKGQHSAIMKYGDNLPAELIKRNPDFCLYYAWILIAAGKIQKAEPFLESAENIVEKLIKNDSSKEANQNNKKLLGKISVAFAYLNSHKEHSQKIFDYCKTAKDNLSEDDPFWFSWAWFSYGIAWFSKGDLFESNKAFNNAFEYGKKSGNIYLISTIAIRMAENEQQLGHYKSAYKKCSDLLTLINDKGYSEIAKTEWTFAALYFIMGVSQFMWADMDRAYGNIKIAYDLCKRGRDIYLKIFILMVYSIVLKERGDIDELKKITDEMDLNLKQNDIPPFLSSSYIGWKIYLFLENNQIEEANNIVSEYGLDPGTKKTHANEGAYSAYVRLLLAQSKLDEAEFLLSELFALAEDNNAIEKIIELKISYAVLFKLRRNQEKAIATLIEAMELASVENLLYYFVNEHDRIKDSIKEAFKVLAATKTNISTKFVDNLKLAIERKEKFKKMNFGIDLSARELDTLKLIEDLSNQEIADKLFISLNTVKTHLKNIYLKIDVDNRTKAVAKAKDLGLI
jgi:LuxR family transcriptional regulator, maltose regulon positive regulatory protein